MLSISRCVSIATAWSRRRSRLLCCCCLVVAAASSSVTSRTPCAARTTSEFSAVAPQTFHTDVCVAPPATSASNWATAPVARTVIERRGNGTLGTLTSGATATAGGGDAAVAMAAGASTGDGGGASLRSAAASRRPTEDIVRDLAAEVKARKESDARMTALLAERAASAAAE